MASEIFDFSGLGIPQNYTIINDSILMDDRLSDSALAFLVTVHVFKCKDTNYITKERLMSLRPGMTRYKYLKVMRELEECGYIERHQRRTADNRLLAGEVVCFKNSDYNPNTISIKDYIDLQKARSNQQCENRHADVENSDKTENPRSYQQCENLQNDEKICDDVKKFAENAKNRTADVTCGNANAEGVWNAVNHEESAGQAHSCVEVGESVVDVPSINKQTIPISVDSRVKSEGVILPSMDCINDVQPECCPLTNQAESSLEDSSFVRSRDATEGTGKHDRFRKLLDQANAYSPKTPLEVLEKAYGYIVKSCEIAYADDQRKVSFMLLDGYLDCCEERRSFIIGEIMTQTDAGSRNRKKYPTYWINDIMPGIAMRADAQEKIGWGRFS